MNYVNIYLDRANVVTLPPSVFGNPDITDIRDELKDELRDRVIEAIEWMYSIQYEDIETEKEMEIYRALFTEFVYSEARSIAETMGERAMEKEAV